MVIIVFILLIVFCGFWQNTNMRSDYSYNDYLGIAPGAKFGIYYEHSNINSKYVKKDFVVKIIDIVNYEFEIIDTLPEDYIDVNYYDYEFYSYSIVTNDTLLLIIKAYEFDYLDTIRIGLAKIISSEYTFRNNFFIVKDSVLLCNKKIDRDQLNSNTFIHETFLLNISKDFYLKEMYTIKNVLPVNFSQDGTQLFTKIFDSTSTYKGYKIIGYDLNSDSLFDPMLAYSRYEAFQRIDKNSPFFYIDYRKDTLAENSIPIANVYMFDEPKGVETQLTFLSFPFTCDGYFLCKDSIIYKIKELNVVSGIQSHFKVLYY